MDRSNINLAQLFQLPVHQIVVANDNVDFNKKGTEKEPDDYPMVYHCAKLQKILGTRYSSEGETLGLDYATGFEFIAPDTGYPEGLLKDLIYDPEEPTKCELLLVVAMYNEGVEHFKNTMVGIANNLKTFVRYGIHPKRIGCCLIIDGVKPFFSTLRGAENEYSRNFFNQFFDEDSIKKRFNVDDPMKCTIPNETEHDEWAHIYMQNIVLDDDRMFPLQLFFTIKQKNKRKLNTHLWFFGGFCEAIQPEYVMLIDVGTKPLKNSLFYMYEAMKVDQQCAGCCGEIKPMEVDLWKLVVPAQEIEYKFSHTFDKAFESIIGYITVLPGAFSAYKWEALQGSPLWDDYFKSTCHPEEMGPFNSNIYLAEDRVLCLSLVSKKGSRNTLRYVRAAHAETDVPESIAELMSQRRRWINGSWFALVDSLKNFSKIHRSNHSCLRRSAFYFQMIYYYASVMISWFMVGSFYVVFAVTTTDVLGHTMSSLGFYLQLLYIYILIMIFILSMGVKPKRVNEIYKAMSVLLGIFMMITFVLTFIYVFKDIDQADAKDWARWAMVVTFGIFATNIIVNWCVTIVARGLFHFIFMTPTYVNIFLIYAISNTHDCSWGNRPDVMTAEELARIEEFEEFRVRWAIIWALCNGCFGWLLTQGEKESDDAGLHVLMIAIMGLGVLSVRGIAGIYYVIKERYIVKHLKKSTSNDLYKQLEAAHKAKKDTLTTEPARSPNTASVAPQVNYPITLDTYKSSDSDSSFHSGSESSEKEEEESNDFPQMLKYAREELDMSLSLLADEVGVPADRLRQIETGEIEPDEDEAEQILSVLNKS